MTDPIERVRALLYREGGLSLDDFITRLIQNQEATLDCLEGLLENNVVREAIETSAHSGDVWRKFKEAVCGGK